MVQRITEDEVRLVYRAVLGREPEDRAVIQQRTLSGISLEQFIKDTIGSQEFSNKFKPRPETINSPESLKHTGANFLTPTDLTIKAERPPRVLLLGSCFMDRWGEVIDGLNDGTMTDRLHIDMHPKVNPPYKWDQYRYQIIQIPIRSVFPGRHYFDYLRNGFQSMSVSDGLLELAKNTLRRWVVNATCWSKESPIFLQNFVVPIQSINGRLFPQHNTRDFRYLVSELNQYLEVIASEIPNTYVLDVNSCAGVFGRRFIHDDFVCLSTHGGLINDGDFQADTQRLVPVAPLSKNYEIHEREFLALVYAEAEASYRSLRGIGAVKMLCVDLDDTLWRGVLAEQEDFDVEAVSEGWPIGIVEALAILSRRGILLCLLSKNDEETVTRIWNRLYEPVLPLTTFAIRKINWLTKAENIAQAIAEANILPDSVIFLDDNPAERHAIASAFPAVRVISSSHYYWKRILLWSSETQGTAITDESSRRTELIQQKIRRDVQKSDSSPEEFLKGLELKLEFRQIRSTTDSRFTRALELVNKTNQFNTNGRRWSSTDFASIAEHNTLLTCTVSDRFSEYGLVAVAMIRGDEIIQIVMSCRVFGLGVEAGFVAFATECVLKSSKVARATITETSANVPCRDLYKKCGWQRVSDEWQTTKSNEIPSYIEHKVT